MGHMAHLRNHFKSMNTFAQSYIYVTYKQHCRTSNVLSWGHRSSCFSTPTSVHSQGGGSRVTVAINYFASGWVSSHCCSYSTWSNLLLRGLVFLLPFSCVSLSLPVQKTVATLTVLEILCNRSPLESSMFSKDFIIFRFFSLPSRIFLSTELSTRWLRSFSSLSTKAPYQARG